MQKPGRNMGFITLPVWQCRDKEPEYPEIVCSCRYAGERHNIFGASMVIYPGPRRLDLLLLSNTTDIWSVIRVAVSLFIACNSVIFILWLSQAKVTQAMSHTITDTEGQFMSYQKANLWNIFKSRTKQTFRMRIIWKPRCISTSTSCCFVERGHTLSTV